MVLRPVLYMGVAQFYRRIRMIAVAVSICCSVVIISVHDSAEAQNQAYGVNIDDPTPAELEFQRAGDAGFGWVRIWLWWRWLEQAQGSIDWSSIDAQVDWAENRGLKVFATVVSIPAWANGSDPNCDLFGDGNCSAPLFDPATYTNFLDVAVRRYKTRVAAWGVWNEPNLTLFWGGTRDRYITDILAAGYQTIKAANPDALVAAPDLAHLKGAQWDEWLRDVLRFGNGAFLDVITHHNYGNAAEKIIADVAGPAGFLKKSARDIVLENGGGSKPFWLTETGVNSCDAGVGEAKQASETVKLMDQSRAYSWWTRTFLYRINDHGDNVHCWGLTGPRPDLTPKQVYTSVQDFLLVPPPPPTSDPGTGCSALPMGRSASPLAPALLTLATFFPACRRIYRFR